MHRLPSTLLFLAFLLALPAVLLTGCLSGGATETETGTAHLHGEAKWPDGRPAVGVRIRLRPSGYLAGGGRGTLPAADSMRDTVTDARGRFAFLRVRPGDYRVEALYPESHGIVVQVRIPGSGRVDLPPLILQSLLTVTGRVRFSDSTLGPASVHVLGTEHYAVADSATGHFTLPEMPLGTVDLRVSTPMPFFPAREFPGLRLGGAGTVPVGDLVLEKGAKQEFTLVGGQLVLAGVQGGNPVLYDNDFSFNTWDNEFLWALASRGRVGLRGQVVTRILRDTLQPMPEEFSHWAREARISRLSGMRNIPEPLLGASRKLAPPPSGRWQDIVPESNPGSLLLLTEARKASREKPLVVVAGGPLTTVANALLLDPYIADRMVVFSIYNQGLNAKDSLANFVVAKRGRFVAWGRDYRWTGPEPTASPLPDNWLGLRMAAHRDTLAARREFFDDFGPLAFLVDGRAWTGARGGKVLSPPLNAAFGAAPFDFLDIPLEANAWGVMDRTFYSVLADSGAYYPWPIPGPVAGVSFRSMAGVAVDSVAGEGEIAGGIGPGDWLEFAVEAAVGGAYDLVVRNRCDSAAEVRISVPGTGAGADLELPAGAGWREARIRIEMGTGVRRVRLTAVKGLWHLSRLRWEPVR